ncbi:MAG: hypothetical protein ABI353_07335 [Isosphaeraceae bacterium]
MPAFHPFPTRPALALAILLMSVPSLAAPPDPAPTLTIVDRAIASGPGPWQSWQVDYTLRFEGPTTLTVEPAAISAEVQGWVSNSRVAAHATPRLSTVKLSGSKGLSARAEVITSTDADRRCGELATLQVWAGDAPDPPEADAKSEPQALEVSPGTLVRVRLVLEHEHQLYGPIDPLLGPRRLELHLGSARLGDNLPLNRPRRLQAADPAWSAEAPLDRLDHHLFLSAPDSVHVEAHVPGHQIFRFPERPIRYTTRYRLSYWYLIAPGSDGCCLARTTQTSRTSGWRTLHDAEQTRVLNAVGRWTKVEQIVRTEPEATHLKLEFSIRSDPDIGELWIDEVRLDLVGKRPDGP